jgi:UDPglucose--hexose-1-phosphate uridylyltransferase
MNTYSAILSVVTWSIKKNYIQKDNQEQVMHSLCLLFECQEEPFYIVSFEEAMTYLVKKGFELNHYPVNTISEMDAFEALIYDYLMPSPQVVKDTFKKLYEHDHRSALNYLHQLSLDVNYIKDTRMKHNVHFVTSFDFGNLELAINLAKPEKDPRDIVHPTDLGEGKPKCLLCKENEQNYFNARKNLRIVPITLAGETWHLQYSPYAYYDEHCIVLHDEHIPMKMGHETFLALLDFVDQFPSYFMGSNAGIPIVGGSILNHWHFQGGKYTFPLEKAKPRHIFEIEGGQVSILNWPIATVRLQLKSKETALKWMNHLYQSWTKYENIELGIMRETTELHQTITPIVRKVNNEYVIHIVLRNNVTSALYPMGVFHSHEDLHHIKKENIGLIEALGLAILPGRLKEELKAAQSYLTSGILTASIEKHLPWLKTLNQQSDLHHEVGKRFKRMLEDASVFKETNEGQMHLKTWLFQALKTI